MPQPRVRVAGSGFTTFVYDGQPIAFMDRFVDTGQEVIGGGGGRGWEAIYQIGSRHAEEIVTSRMLGVGTITCTIRELWNFQIWEQLHNLAGTNDLSAVYERLAQQPELVTCQMVITPPGGSGRPRGKVYHNCVVTAIGDGETIEVGSLSVAKDLSITYTHTTPL